MPVSETVEWATPQAFYDYLHERYDFQVDVAASSLNHLCEQWYGLDHPDESRRDGLTATWSGRVWCNPPYGRVIKEWVKKASEHDDLVVMLLPARTDTRWFHDYCLALGKVKYVRGRLKFGGGQASAPFPSIVVIFNDN